MVVEKLYEYFLKSTGVSTDTRSIKEGNIFFALKGPSFNGNEFALKALENGAAFAVVDEDIDVNNSRLLRVADGLTALQNLARHHRRQFKGPVIGLTGSNGKTTTKELINAVLSCRYKTIATQGNLNNHIGVPLTLLRIEEETDIAIIEMGANHVGEIAILCSIAEPSCGLITNIGKAHIGTFGGFENIIRGKSELFDFLIKTDGIIWLNSADPVLENMQKRIKNPITYPENEKTQTYLIGANPYVIYSDNEKEITRTHLIGEYNFVNIAAARAVGVEMGITNEEANTAIAAYIPENNRSQILKIGQTTVILDAYNANPSSMAVAIETFQKMEGDPKMMILGDMYELGGEEENEHISLGVQANDSGIDTCFVGKLTRVSAEQGEKLKWFEKKEDLKNYLEDRVKSYNTILIKGSRGIRLEEIVEWIKKID